MIFLLGLFLFFYGVLGNFFSVSGTDGTEFIYVGVLLIVLDYVIWRFSKEPKQK